MIKDTLEHIQSLMTLTYRESVNNRLALERRMNELEEKQDMITALCGALDGKNENAELLVFKSKSGVPVVWYNNEPITRDGVIPSEFSIDWDEECGLSIDVSYHEGDGYDED